MMSLRRRLCRHYADVVSVVRFFFFSYYYVIIATMPCRYAVDAAATPLLPDAIATNIVVMPP